MDQSPIYSNEQAQARLQAGLPHWRVVDGQLLRDYRTADFRTALVLANAIGHVAELAWHHPDLTVSWGRVRVQLMSHDVGGITERDFELAAEIERLAEWRPGADSALSGTPDEERWRYRVAD
jgi:4a-hydroxytetrahydrobiopterin dehydratase